MAAIPDKYLDLLQQKKAFANLATLMPDGSPQVTPVWIDYANGAIRFNTAKGRVKARNLKVGSPVALAIMDPDQPYRYLQVRGRVSRVADQGGWFCFSTEMLEDDEDFALRTTLRYAHSERFIRRLAEEYGFAIDRIDKRPVREDRHQPIPGLFVFLTKR